MAPAPIQKSAPDGVPPARTQSNGKISTYLILAVSGSSIGIRKSQLQKHFVVTGLEQVGEMQARLHTKIE